MKFIFDCADDKTLLPILYQAVDDFGAFAGKMKQVEQGKNAPDTNMEVLKNFLRNAMVNYPEETAATMAKLWVLEEGETAPNSLITMSVLFSNKVFIDFFTSALPSLLQLSKGLSTLLS